MKCYSCIYFNKNDSVAKYCSLLRRTIRDSDNNCFNYNSSELLPRKTMDLTNEALELIREIRDILKNIQSK